MIFFLVESYVPIVDNYSFLMSQFLKTVPIHENCGKLIFYIVPNGWNTKFGMIKCKTTDTPEFQNYEY